MNRKLKLFCLFLYLLLYSLIVLYILSLKNSSLQNINSLTNNESKAHSKTILMTDFDNFCDKYGEWELVDDTYYFKRSGAFYFLDAGIFRLNLIKSSKAILIAIFLDLNITLSNNYVFNYTLDKSIIESRWKVGEYELMYIDVKFDLYKILKKNPAFYDNYLEIAANSNIDVIIQIEQPIKEAVRTKNKIRVKLKHLYISHKEKPKSAMICSKCLYTHKYDTNANNLKWWIEVNKLAGYEKIALCNQSITNNINYRELFERNKDVLSITQLKCVPNLLDGKISRSSYYLDSYSALIDSNKIAVIDSLILSECYLDNFNYFKYITIIDSDEVILTKKLDNQMDTFETIHYVKSIELIPGENDMLNISDHVFFKDKCHRYESTISTSKIEDFLNELNRKKPQAAYTKSFYFTQAFYIKNNLAEKIFQSLDIFLKNTTEYTLNQKEMRITIEFEDEGDFTVKNKNFLLYYLFTISNQHELEYAKNLLGLYKLVLKPYINANAEFFTKYVKDFDRFFFISGKVNDYSWGKSLHNTSHAFDFTVHHANKYISNFEKYPFSVDWDFLTQDYAKYYRLPYKLAYLSHFRSYFHNKPGKIPISSLHIDLNYLNCYFIPLLENIKKNN